jgi:tRNA threonylcarbamoyl adenosine modification protein (Sua5/YciO/YrdC/YwlC family)
MDFFKASKNASNKAKEAINGGKIVIFPTDTVYGFLALAENKKSVEKIYKIKKRPKSMPFPVFVKDIKMAKELAEISKNQEKILRKYWPGKYTFVLKSKNKKLLITKNGTIALRIPKYKPLNDLLKKINKPLAQTSVNISGENTLFKPEEIKKQFEKSKDLLFINAGSLPKRKPSVIIDLTKDKINIIRK